MTETAQRAGHIPGAASDPVGPDGPRGRHVQEPRRAERPLRGQGRDARQGRHRLLPDRRAVAATRGSSSTSCSATSASATTTAAGPSGAAWSACRSRSRSPSRPDRGAARRRGTPQSIPGLGMSRAGSNEVRLGRHVLIAVGDPEAEVEQRPEHRARALDRRPRPRRPDRIGGWPRASPAPGRRRRRGGRRAGSGRGACCAAGRGRYRSRRPAPPSRTTKLSAAVCSVQ